MEKGNQNKLQALHNLLDKELQLLSDQLNTETDQGYLFQNSYIKRIRQSEELGNERADVSQFQNKIQGMNTSTSQSKQQQQTPFNMEQVKRNESKLNIQNASPQDKNGIEYFNQKDNLQQNTKIHNDWNDGQNMYAKQKQTFITDYGSQISFQQRTSQHNSQTQSDVFDTEGQQTNPRNLQNQHLQSTLDPFANVNLQNEINALSQKINYLESKLHSSSRQPNHTNTNNHLSNLEMNHRIQNNEWQIDEKNSESNFNKFNAQKDTENLNLQNTRKALQNEKYYNNYHQQSDKSPKGLNDQNILQTIKSPQDNKILRIDSYLNTQETFKLENQNQNEVNTIKHFPNYIKDKAESNKQNQNNSMLIPSLRSSSKSPNNIIMRQRSISAKSSAPQIINYSLGGLEKDIEGAEYSLDISKRSLKQTLNKSSSRKNLRTSDSTSTNRSRQIVSQSTLGQRYTSQKQQRERSLSYLNGQVFFPIDNYAQQYHDAVELKQKITTLRKQYEVEKQMLAVERQNNTVINEQTDRIQIKIKKLSMLVDKNLQSEKDYYKLLESYNKSDAIRKQQKLLIAQLKEEIEIQKNNQNRSSLYISDNKINTSKRRNSKRLSTSSSQKYSKK